MGYKPAMGVEKAALTVYFSPVPYRYSTANCSTENMDLVKTMGTSSIPNILYDAPRSKRSPSARGEKSDPECENGPNGFELDAALFWASGTQWY